MPTDEEAAEALERQKEENAWEVSLEKGEYLREKERKVDKKREIDREFFITHHCPLPPPPSPPPPTTGELGGPTNARQYPP